jgi:hypothetical protein
LTVAIREACRGNEGRELREENYYSCNFCMEEK